MQFFESIAEAVFRANPTYELVLFDRLQLEERAALRDLCEEPDFYGILRPRQPSALGMKSVCRETALLFLTLQEPGKLPAYVQTLFGEHTAEAVVRLVLDCVLEIRLHGTFVSGAGARALIATPEPSGEGGFIHRLSLAALQYAQALPLNDSAKLSARLYFYHRIPVSPVWKRRLSTPGAVAGYLGLQPGDGAQKLLEQCWSDISLSLHAPNDGWLMWDFRRGGRSLGRERLTHKLYVSPAPEHLREAFETVVEVFTDLRVLRFKVGKDVYGLLRPDKIVAYFECFSDVRAAAERLERQLAGCPAQGVPFTAELGGNGLLSWGADPPRTEQVLRWRERESWRLWLTNRLASALLAAKETRPATVEPWQFALERLRLEGVDTESWIPVRPAWHREGEA